MVSGMMGRGREGGTGGAKVGGAGEAGGVEVRGRGEGNAPRLSSLSSSKSDREVDVNTVASLSLGDYIYI